MFEDLLSRVQILLFYNKKPYLERLGFKTWPSMARKSGTVKKLIIDVLKNDMCFFIQQNSGRMSLRKWAENYTRHTIPSWSITPKPKPTRQFSDFKYYYSSLDITYHTSAESTENIVTYLNNTIEDITVAKWKKRAKGIFKTDLGNENQAKIFSDELLARFGNRAQLWSVGVGHSTSEIELLDSLTLPLVITDPVSKEERVLSEFTNWKIIGINPGQDTLLLEEDTYSPIAPVANRTGAPLSHPFVSSEDGYNSHIMIVGESGIMSKNSITEEEQ